MAKFRKNNENFAFCASLLNIRYVYSIYVKNKKCSFIFFFKKLVFLGDL